MSKLVASLAVAAIATGVALAGSGVALADDKAGDTGDTQSCTSSHALNVANCVNLDLLSHIF